MRAFLSRYLLALPTYPGLLSPPTRYYGLRPFLYDFYLGGYMWWRSRPCFHDGTGPHLGKHQRHATFITLDHLRGQRDSSTAAGACPPTDRLATPPRPRRKGISCRRSLVRCCRWMNARVARACCGCCPLVDEEALQAEYRFYEAMRQCYIAGKQRSPPANLFKNFEFACVVKTSN